MFAPPKTKEPGEEGVHWIIVKRRRIVINVALLKRVKNLLLASTTKAAKKISQKNFHDILGRVEFSVWTKSIAKKELKNKSKRCHSHQLDPDKNNSERKRVFG